MPRSWRGKGIQRCFFFNARFCLLGIPIGIRGEPRRVNRPDVHGPLSPYRPIRQILHWLRSLIRPERLMCDLHSMVKRVPRA
jgi:hypothetical protein